jgi:hypothetical protein
MTRTLDSLNELSGLEIESAAKRYRACYAICKAAQSDDIHLVGKVKEGDLKDEPIQSSYFDYPRTNERCNKLISDIGIERLSEPTVQEYVRQRQIDHKTWFDVRIQKDSLKHWLFSEEKRAKKTSTTVKVAAILKELGEKANAPMKMLRPMIEKQLGRSVSEKTISRARKET